MTGLTPAPVVPAVLRIPKRVDSYTRHNGDSLPSAARTSVACPFLEEFPKHLDLLSMVTAGRTSPNLEGALEAWGDLIGEPVPEEAMRVIRRYAQAPHPETVTEELVDKGLRLLIKGALDGFNVNWEQGTRTSYAEGENTTLVGHPDCFETYSVADYYGHQRAERSIASLAIVLALPEARKSAGLISAEIIVAHPKARRHTY